jgi:transcriptional regulator with XRE-family HTH domain
LKLPRLKEVRELHGWSQAKLAEESDVSRDSISNYETGQREAWPATAKKLADALHVEIADLREPARELATSGKADAPARSGLSEASSFHMAAETFNGVADLLRWQLARVQPEQLPSLVYQGIAAADRAAQQKRRDVDPLLDDALEEELAAAQEVDKALNAIEEALYAIGKEAKRLNKGEIAADVEDELAAHRHRKSLRGSKQARHG